MKAKILALIVMVAMAVCVLASCSMLPEDLANKLQGAVDTVKDKVNGIINPNGTPDAHEHNFVEGKCECGETDPTYVAPHEHNFVEGKCECGATDPTYVAPHEHNFVEGKCECGETDPNYVPPTPAPDGTAENPYALTVPGELNVALTDGQYIWYTFTATETKTLGITLSSANAIMGYGLNADSMTYIPEGATYVTVDLVADTTYVVNFGTVNGAAEEYNVTAAYVEKVDPYTAALAEGKNALVLSAAEIEANTAVRNLTIVNAGTFKFAGDVFVASVVAADGTAIEKIDYMYFELAAGEYTVTFGMFSTFGVLADTEYIINVEDINASDDDDPTLPSEGPLDAENSDLVIGENTVVVDSEAAAEGAIKVTIVVTAEGTFAVESNDLGATFSDETGYVGRGQAYLTAGTYTIALFNIEGLTEGSEYTFTLTYTAPEGGNDEEDDTLGDFVISGQVDDEWENIIEISAEDKEAGYVYYTFVPYYTGEYTFASNDLWVMCVYYNGEALQRNTNYCYELEQYETYVLEINLSYTGTGSYTLTPEYNYPEGHQNNPIWLTLGEETVANYLGNYSPIYYSFYANATGTLTVTTAFEGALLSVNAVGGWAVESDTGSVTLDVMQGREYVLCVSIADFELAGTAADIAFTAAITEGDITVDGTANLPYSIVIGNNAGNVDSWACVYYMFKAETNGVLTVSTAATDIKWYFIKDLTSWDEAVNGEISVQLYTDEIVYLYVEWASEEHFDPIAFEFNASFKADPTEVYYEDIVVSDGSAANNVAVADNTYTVLSFNGVGKFQITWDNTNALVYAATFGAPATLLANGDIIDGDNWGNNLKICFADYAAGNVNVTITPVIDPESILAAGDNTVSVVDSWAGALVYLPVSESNDVVYTIVLGENAVLVHGYDTFFPGDTCEIIVAAGEIVSLTIATYDYSAADVVITLSVKEEAAACAHENTTTTNTATCTAAGVKTVVCDDCGATVSTEDVEALGHDYVSHVCSVCDAIEEGNFEVTIPEANKLADGVGIIVSGTVSQINSAWSDSYNNITVTIVDAEGNTLYVYRLATKVALGDIITVTGVMGSYNDSKQVAQGATAEITGHDTSYDYEEMTIAEALAAADGTNIIVTGIVTKIGTAYSSSYNNISVYISDGTNTIYLYRLTGNVAVNDIITVKGTMATYSGARQIAGGTFTANGTHTCTFGEATCAVPATCAQCGATTGTTTNVHTYVNGTCSVCGATEGVTYVTAGVTIEDYHTANGWTNGVKYTSLNVDENITVTASGTDANTGKYYDSGFEWRMYQTGNPSITVTAANGKTIKSVKITYNINKTGILTLNGANIASGTVVDVDAASVTFGVGNTDTATNGQVKITAIEVIYG